MNKMIALCLVAALAGCATAQGPAPADTRPLPAQAMEPCPDVPPLEDKTFAGAVNKLVELAGLYKECRAKQEEEADWIKRGRK